MVYEIKLQLVTLQLWKTTYLFFYCPGVPPRRKEGLHEARHVDKPEGYQKTHENW